MFDDALELEFFDQVANDLPHQMEVRAQLWKKRIGADVDPVHQDFNRELYHGPFDIVASADQGFAKSLSVDPDAGLEATRDSEIWVTRKELERVDYGPPEIGDVIAIFLDQLPSAYYLYIQNAEREGRLPQARAFVMWRLEVKYMSKADPEGALSGDPCVIQTGRRID